MIFVFIICYLLSDYLTADISFKSKPEEHYELDWQRMNRDAALYGNQYVHKHYMDGGYRK